MKFIVSILLVFSSFWIYSQEEPDLSTPRSSVKNLFDNQRDEQNDLVLASKSLYQGDLTDKEIQKRAKHFVQIFRGKGVDIVHEAITVDSNYMNHETQAQELLLDSTFKNIYLKKYGDQWLIKEESVAEIPALYREIYPFGTHKALDWLTSLGHKKYFGIKTWQAIGLFLIILLCFLVQKILSFVVEKGVLQVLIQFKHKELVEVYIEPVTRPLILLLVAYMLTVLVPILQFDLSISYYLIMGVNATVPLFVTLVFYKFVDVVTIYLKVLASHTETTLDDQLVPLVRRTMKVFVLVVGTLFILQNLNFNVTALLAGLSISGLAFALASQDMIKNLFGSIMIFVDRPFQIGDWVIGNGIDGSVEEVGFRSTRIRTFANSLVTIPNGMIADMVIDNMGMREYRRYKTNLTITYDTPTEKVEAFVEGLKKIIELHPHTRKDYYHVVFNSFGSSSLDILLYVFFKVPDWGMELKARHEFNLEIMSLAEELGVRFAFNTQTLHVEDFPEKKSLTPDHNVDQAALNNVVASYQPKNFKNEN